MFAAQQCNWKVASFGGYVSQEIDTLYHFRVGIQPQRGAKLNMKILLTEKQIIFG